QTRNLAISADDFDLAVGNQEELLCGIAFADDRLAGSVVTFRHLFRHIGELARSQCLEQLDRSEELADPQCIVQDHIRPDAVAEPEALQNAGATPPYFGRRSISELRRHLDVLVSGKRVE